MMRIESAAIQAFHTVKSRTSMHDGKDKVRNQNETEKAMKREVKAAVVFEGLHDLRVTHASPELPWQPGPQEQFPMFARLRPGRGGRHLLGCPAEPFTAAGLLGPSEVPVSSESSSGLQFNRMLGQIRVSAADQVVNENSTGEVGIQDGDRNRVTGFDKGLSHTLVGSAVATVARHLRNFEDCQVSLGMRPGIAHQPEGDLPGRGDTGIGEESAA